jgi:hypothetical protein
VADTHFERKNKSPLRIRFAWVLLANTLIPKGTYAMNDAGVVKRAVSPAPAGAVLLGSAEDDYDNRGNGSNKTFTTAEGPMLFSYGEMTVLLTAGDEPTDADLGKSVFLQDERNVGRTNAGTDVSVTWNGTFNNQNWIDAK